MDVGSFHMRLFGTVYMTCGDFHDGSEIGTASVQQHVDTGSGKSVNGCHPHPPYSPDLAPRDFFLLPEIKLKLKGRRFDTIEEIQAESQRVLDTDRKGLPESIQKMKELVGPVSTCGRELF
jgi:hypothetical protein